VLFSHRRPFLIDRIVDVLGDERAKPGLRFGGKTAASKLTVLSELASVATGTFARSKSLHTCAAMKPTNSPKMMPRGGSIPGEALEGPRPAPRRQGS
jgi:hypothetical protein